MKHSNNKSINVAGPSHPVPPLRVLAASLAVAFIALSSSPDARAQALNAELSKEARACADLRNLQLPEATVTGAELVTSGSFSPPAAGDALRGAQTGTLTKLPAFCRVMLTLQPQIKVEVWMPSRSWNKRFQAVGGGGYAGFIAYDSLASAIRDGYASASTDTGHTTSQLDGKFVLNADRSLNEQQLKDFAYRAVHEMTVKSKSVIRSYYRSAPRYSYWNGCSTGGRQGLMEAQRFPEDYDGILSQAPAINWDRFVPAEIWPQLVMRLDLGGPIAPAKLVALREAIISANDRLDGVEDGVVDQPDQLEVSDELMKRAGLNDREIAAVRKIWAGPRTSGGDFLWYGIEPTAPLDAMAGPQPFPIPVDYIGTWLQRNPQWDWKTMDYAEFERFFQQSRQQYNALIGTDNPDLRAFASAGGKLLMVHGWDDQLIMPRGTIDYHRRVQEAAGGARSSSRFARLFMAPGNFHCSGGPGPDTFNTMETLVNWVEKGKAPERLMATKLADGKPVRTRPLCVYPQTATYSGKGSTDNASSFVCTAPKPSR